MTKNLNNLICGGALALIAAWANPVYAQRADGKKPDSPAQSELETLRAQLAARQSINEELSRRIEALERQLAAQSRNAGPVAPSLDANFPKPPKDAPRGDAVTAIEEALMTKGLALMPAGTLRGTPSATWAHNGTGASRADSYAAGLTLEAGLPWGMAVALSMPYIWQDFASGTNRGIGDPSIAVAKKLANESGAMPSLLLRLSYTDDGGKDPFTLPAVASGFRAVNVSLSAVKRFDPLVFYGNISYGHAFPKFATISIKNTSTILFQGTIAPGDAYGLGMGVSLAATPEVALDAGLSFSFANSSRYELLGTAVYPGRATVGYLNVGVSTLLTKNMSLAIGAAAGVTKDAGDFVFSVALPYRF